MSNVGRLSAFGVVLFGLAILLSVPSQAIELTGAWTTQSDLCKLLFTKKGDQITFTDLSDFYGSGFIINGKQIKAKAAQCTIESRTQDGNNIRLASSCATGIMTSSVVFNLTVIDDNNISRIIPEVPGMSMNYTRCTL